MTTLPQPPPPLTAEPDLPVGLAVSATPNPCDRYTVDSPIPPPHPRMWFYETRVANTTDRPLQVVTYGIWQQVHDAWVPVPAIMTRPLGTRDFRACYRRGALDADGWLAPGAAATDPENWHGGSKRTFPPVRWVYIARDPDDRLYTGHVDIISTPPRRHWLPKVRRCCGPDSCLS